MMGTVRFRLFMLWLVVFGIYVTAFQTLPYLKPEISDKEAADAAWKSAYILLPIVVAFGSFYFGNDFNAELEDTETIHPRRAKAVIMFTALFHVLVLTYFCFHVFLARYSFPVNDSDSFAGRVSDGHKWLMMLSVLAVTPVGFVLKRPEMKDLASAGDSKSIPRKKKTITPLA
jgi:membrane-associated phospholipid phosphatase